MLSAARLLVAAAAIAAVLIGAPAAGAAAVSKTDTTLRYQDDLAVRDLLQLSLADGDTNVLFTITSQPGQVLTAQSPCTLASATTIKCPRASIERIVIDLGDGDDILNFSASTIPIRLEAGGGPGVDSLRGGAGADALDGGPGGDSVRGGLGADDMRGGAGFDLVSYCCDAAPVKASIDDVANDGTGGGAEGDNVHTDVEDLSGGNGNDELIGSALGNVLDGRNGNDTIDGRGGTDEFFGDDGDDTLLTRDGDAERVHCGLGNDTVTADDVDEGADCETFNASGDLVRDLDKDGVSKPDDCDDANPAVRPGLADTPDDGIDQDCDGVDATVADRDGDGVARPFDCDDANGAIRPGAREVFGNPVDEDCSGRADPLQTLQTPVLSRFVAGRRATSIRRLVAERLDAGTRVELQCSGRRCPFKTRAFDLTRTTSKLDLRKSAKLRSLRGTATLDVMILREDSIGRVFRYRFRNRTVPRVQILCKAPSDPKPRAC